MRNMQRPLPRRAASIKSPQQRARRPALRYDIRVRIAQIAGGLFLAAFVPANAYAHLGLDSPTSRYGPEVLKTGPCGVEAGERTSNVSYFEPGETIEVRWDEYVDHPGHYRIAFDDDGDDDFVDPAEMMELYSNDTVLLDGIVDGAPGERDYRATVTLPYVTCENCTLQVIQVMYDKPPYTTPGNDIYYQCADLVLRFGDPDPDAGIDPDPDAGIDPNPDAGIDPVPGASGGCRAANGAIAGLGLWPLLFLLLTRRLARGPRSPV